MTPLVPAPSIGKTREEELPIKGGAIMHKVGLLCPLALVLARVLCGSRMIQAKDLTLLGCIVALAMLIVEKNTYIAQCSCSSVLSNRL
jgi:hypothetical protein